MISYLQGKVFKNDSPHFIILNNGVGYSVLTNDYLVEGSEVALYIESIYKEDSVTLIGFTNHNTSVVFRSLLAISGIGASKALSILKNVPMDVLLTAVKLKDKERLLSFKGISEKLAYAIVSSLKIPTSLDTKSEADIDITTEEDEIIAVRTLTELGFDEGKARNAVLKARDNIASDVEDKLSYLVTSALGVL